MSNDTPTAKQKLTGADNHPLHSDAELVRRWLYSQRKVQRANRGTPLRAKVSEVFCVGSTSANDICIRHGYNPYEMVKK